MSASLALFLLASCGGEAEKGDLSGTEDPARAEERDRGNVLMDMGDRAMDKGNVDGASALYEQSARVDPKSADRWARLGDAMFKQGRYVQAESAYAKARGLAADEDAAELALAHGKTLLALYRSSEATEAFREYLARAEEPSVSVLNGLGVALDQSGRHKEARVAYDQALELDPNDLSARNNKALSFLLSGDLPEARVLMRDVVADAKANERNHMNLALVLGLEGREAEAAELARPYMREAEVLENLAFYQRLRRLPEEERNQAILRAARGLPEDKRFKDR